VARRNCLLAAGKIKEYERAAGDRLGSCEEVEESRSRGVEKLRS
jgi:hypothetical protein